jgi:y4mF family transcriptional regulator
MARKNRKSKSVASSFAAAVSLTSTAELGDAVRAARAARGLTQDEVAGKAKVSRKFVIDVESGKESLHLGKVLAVLKCAGLVGMVMPAEAMKR